VLLDRHRRFDRCQQGPAGAGGAPNARGARRWNDANVLALSLRTTSAAQLVEIFDAWFDGAPSEEPDDRANVEHLGAIERDSP
jgi:ribose 5-phosphate isomerase B